MGLQGIIWKESRSILVNVLILLFIFILGVIAILFVTGLFGVAWAALMSYLGWGNLTIEEAIAFYGDPKALTAWFDSWLSYAAQKALDFLNWLWSMLKPYLPGATDTEKQVAGAAIAGGTAGAIGVKATVSEK